MQYSVLISEDDHSLADIWRKTLIYSGYQVDLTYDGKAALEAWTRMPYDLILLDLNTPIIKGGELLERIKLRQPWAQVIIISGFGGEEDKMHALKHHVYDYLVKPITTEQLLQTLLRALDDRDLVIRAAEAMIERSTDPNQPALLVNQQPVSPLLLYDAVRIGSDLGNKYRADFEHGVVNGSHHQGDKAEYRLGGVIE